MGGILVETVDAVTTLRLNDPPRNAIGVAQVEALEAILPELAVERASRVLVICGAGNAHFSVGANLKEGARAVETGVKEFVGRRSRLFSAIETFEKPVIAAIRGYCLGGGLELAMACHFRIADSTARFGLPEVNLGAAPMWGGVNRLMRLVGRAQALDLVLRGIRIDGERAQTLGLINELVDVKALEQRVDSFARELAEKPPLAVAAMLRVINQGADRLLSDALEYELEEFSKLGGTKDNIEGVRAFFEKRKPHFTGE